MTLPSYFSGMTTTMASVFEARNPELQLWPLVSWTIRLYIRSHIGFGAALTIRQGQAHRMAFKP